MTLLLVSYTQYYAVKATTASMSFQPPQHCKFQLVQSDRMQYSKQVAVDISLQDCHEQYIVPVNGVNNEGPFHFQLDPVRDTVLPMDQLTMYMRAEVVDEKGTALNYKSNVHPINFLLNTMWRSIECRVNGNPINLSAAQNVGYKSIMQAQLSIDAQSATSYMSSLFTPESSKTSASSLHAGQDASNRVRRELTNLGAGEFEMTGPITGVDFLQSDSYLAPFNSLSLTFTRQLDEFIFMTPQLKKYTEDEIKELVKDEKHEYDERADLLSYASRRTKPSDYNEKKGIFQYSKDADGNLITDESLWITKEDAWSHDPAKPEPRWQDKNYLYSWNPSDWEHKRTSDRNNLEKLLAMVKEAKKLWKDKEHQLANQVQLYPKLKIKEFGLFARRIELSQSALKMYFQPKEVQRYKGSVIEVNSYALTTGIDKIFLTAHTAGVLPKQLVVGMVETSAVVGSYRKNPFEFQHFGLNRISLKVNAIRTPQEPLEPDFDNNLYMRSYVHMLMNSGHWKTETGNCISPKTFANGVTLFPFDLTPDLCGSYHTHAGKEGTVELEMGFKNPLEKQVTVFVFSCKDQIVLIDPVKNGEPANTAF